MEQKNGFKVVQDLVTMETIPIATVNTVTVATETVVNSNIGTSLCPTL